MPRNAAPYLAALALVAAAACDSHSDEEALYDEDGLFDECSTPESGSAVAIEIGQPWEDFFVPLTHGATVPSVPDGSKDMLGLRLGVIGDAPPACLAHTTKVRSPRGDLLLSVDTPVHTYEQPDGSVATLPMWLRFPPYVIGWGKQLTIETETEFGMARRPLVMGDPVMLFGGNQGSVQYTIAAGGTGVITVPLAPERWGAGSVQVFEVAGRGAVAFPREIWIPEEAEELRFRVRADGPGTADLRFVSEAGEVLVATIEVGDAEPAGITPDLDINEVLYDSTSSMGDVNCDGVRNARDHFVELYNSSNHAVSLAGVVLRRIQPLVEEPQIIHAFGEELLGPGEVLVAMGAEPGDAPAGAWCSVRAGPDRIGDAALVVIAPFELLEDDRLEIHVTGQSEALASFTVWYPAPRQSFTRSPDFTGSFRRYSSITGPRPDRIASPGTRVDGVSFLLADVAGAGE